MADKMKQQEYTGVPPGCNQPRNDEESANLQSEELHRKNMRNTRISIGACALFSWVIALQITVIMIGTFTPKVRLGMVEFQNVKTDTGDGII